MSSNSVFGLVRKSAVLVVLLLGVGLTYFPSQTNASPSSSPFQNEYAHYVVSKEKKARCTNLRSLYGLGNVHYEPPANPLLAHSGPGNGCDGDDQQQPKTNAVPASQAVLDPQASPSADTQQQANQESFLVAALASNNPNEKVSELTALLPVSGATHAGALDVNHENLVLHEDSDHIGIFQGEFNKTTATKCGLGAFMGKAFPGMYVGNWSLNFKHGYGFNLRCCGKRFIAEGYEWNQGVPIRKWIMPSTLRDAISALDVCAFKGIKTLVELLSKVPRSHVMEQLTAGPTSILDENDNYRIVIDGDGRQLEILGGKQDDNTSLVPSAMKDESPHCRFCVTALGSNRYVIFPSHSLCHALAPADVPATEGSSIVQAKYVEGDERFNWSVERNNSDTFTIRHEQTGLVMTASEPGTFKMSLSKYSSLPTQSFVFDKYSTPSLSSKDPSKALHEGNIYMVQNVGQKTYWARKGKGTTTNTKLSSEPLMKDVNYNHYLFKATQAQLKGPATVWQFDTVGIGKELRLDIPGSNTSENIEPMFWTPHTNANQQYELVPVDGKPGVFMVKCVHSGLFLTTQCSGVVSQRKKNESNPDQWYQFFEGKQSAQLVDGKKYNIQSKNMSAMLQSLNGNVQQVKGSSMTTGSGQSDETFKWIARHLGNDTYAFQPVNNTSMALATVSDKGTVALIKYDAANSWCRWKCSRMEDFGLFTLVNEATGLNLTSNIEDGKLVTSKATGGNNQEFSITDSN